MSDVLIWLATLLWYANSLYLESILRGNQPTDLWCKSIDWYLRNTDFKCKKLSNGL